jgi:hypothetical protein
MPLEQLKKLVAENPSYFCGVSPETAESIAAAEQPLGHKLPVSMKWLLSQHGYSTACGLDSLDEAVRLTLEHRRTIHLPARYVVLNNWDDAGIVWMDTLPTSAEGEHPIFWSGAHNYLRLASGDRLGDDVHAYADYGEWVAERLEDARELEPDDTAPDPDIMTGQPLVSSDSQLGRVLRKVGLAVLAVSGIVLLVHLGILFRWKTADGILDRAQLSWTDKAGRVSSHGGHQDIQWRYYRPSVSYTYSVDGKQYEGTSYAPRNLPAARSLGQKQTDELQQKIGKPVKVWYQPGNPSNSALVLPLSTLVFGWIALGAAVCFAGMALENSRRAARIGATVAAIGCTAAFAVCVMMWLAGETIQLQ